MKFMLMMHASKAGWSDAGIGSWPMDDIKAHIGFMMRFNQELTASGVLVGAEGLAGPEEARVVRAQGNGSPAVTNVASRGNGGGHGARVLRALEGRGRSLSTAGRHRGAARRGAGAGDRESAVRHYLAAAGKTASVPERDYLTLKTAPLGGAR